MTTPHRLAELARNPIDIEQPSDWVGQWVSLTLDPFRKSRGPLAQLCPLGEEGYDEVIKLTLGEITVFGPEPDPIRSLGAAANNDKALASSLAVAGRMFEGAPSAHTLFKMYWEIAQATPQKICIFDVGHASFSSVLSSKNKPIIHFDAGWPIGFNHATYPAKLPTVKPANIVVLSHWDWDHLHGYHKWPHLKKCTWVTPVQDLGPGALRVAEKLDHEHRLISIGINSRSMRKTKEIGQFKLHYVDPSSEKNKSKIRNNSGLALSVNLLSGKQAMMPGDADYDKILPRNYPKPDLLVVSHHGATVSGNIVRPRKKNGKAVVSLGLGNKYGHPCIKTIATHKKNGWNLAMTCDNLAHKRGNRTLK